MDVVYVYVDLEDGFSEAQTEKLRKVFIGSEVELIQKQTINPMSWGGYHTVESELHAYKEMAENSPNELFLIMNVDSDLILLSDSIILKAMSSKCNVVGHLKDMIFRSSKNLLLFSERTQFFQGSYYFINSCLAPEMYHYYHSHKKEIIDFVCNLTFMPPETIPPDITMTRIVKMLGEPIDYQKFLADENVSAIHLELTKNKHWKSFGKMMGILDSGDHVIAKEMIRTKHRPKVLFVYERNWSVYDVGRLWFENNDEINIDCKTVEELKAYPDYINNFDLVWFGANVYYQNFMFDLNKSVITIQDPNEFRFAFGNVKGGDVSGHNMNLLRSYKNLVVTYDEFKENLQRKNIHSDVLPTGSLLPIREYIQKPSESSIITVHAGIDNDRKNITMLRSLLNTFTKMGIKCKEKVGMTKLPVDKYQELLDNYSIYLCTSRLEGGPIPAMDAMTRGAIVLSTPVGQMSDLIEDGINGFICHTEQEFVDRIKSLNPETLHNMRLNSLRIIQEKRSLKNIRTKVSEYVKKTIGGSNG